jgi:PD-(D/E)XK nuclease superfamily
MSDIAKMLVGALAAHDNQRDRSVQVDVGPSSIGDCKRRVFLNITQAPKVNATDSLPAIMGTFIHAGIAEAIKREDPFNDNFMIEQEFSIEGLRGHIDLYIKDKKQIVDWKTTKVKSLRYFPSEQQRMQVQVYGYLLTQNGYEVEKVTLVALARDGGFANIREHTEPYDPKMAERGIEWLAQVKEMAKNGEIPEPEKSVYFCQLFCDYYDATGVNGCPSKSQ